MSLATIEVYRTPEERFASLPDYPFVPKYIVLDELRLHYVDEGSGPPCLLLHGEPTWSFLYRKIIPRLVAAGLRAVAPDYIGFGRSDKPTELSAYSYQGHVRSMLGLVRALDLRGITLVVHDWGGPIGLRLAALEPSRIARLVILDTGLFVPGVILSPGLRRWKDYATVQPDLDVAEVMRRSCVRPIAPEVAAAYAAPFPTRASRAGARAFPMLIPESASDPGAFQMLETMQIVSRQMWPALVLWGAEDPVFPVEVGRVFAGMFAGADLNVIEGAGHFVQEDAGPALADRIVGFARSTW
jgi:haloalkane dehalogenase